VFELVDDIGSSEVGFSASMKASMPLLAPLPVWSTRQVNDRIPTDRLFPLHVDQLSAMDMAFHDSQRSEYDDA